MKRLAALLLTLAAAPGAAAEAPFFTDVATETGLDFTHWNGMTGKFYFPEMTGQGAALFDFDNDGDLDAYLVQGALLGSGEKRSDALFPYQGTWPPSDRLYRNDLSAGRLKLTDVTAASGLAKLATGYGMGVATGDVDNDGFTDLYVTNYGSNQLLRNQGDGTFRDVTAAAGVDDPAWSTSAAFFDFDRDGWLDLYVANYVTFDVGRNPECFAASSRRDYCGPSAFPGVADRLWRNRGDGTFEDVSVRARIGAHKAAGLGVAVADYDGDGWLDLYVANDGEDNHLWLNQRGDADGTVTFRDEALLAGVAVNREGEPEASMGVTAGDFDGDGDDDLFMTHLMSETNTLYVNDGGLFEDRTLETGLAASSLAFTSFGTAWLDVDNDGWLDLMIANGAVKVLEALAQDGDLFPLDQPNQLLINAGGRRFEDATARAGAAFQVAEVSRGAAFGDLDNDGDVDVLLLNNNGPARLLRNGAGQRQPWLGLRLIGGKGGRDMLGARAQVRRAGAPTLWRRAHTDGSYCSANDPRVLFGLGGGAKLAAVRVHWPDGTVETWPPPELGRYTTLRQGTAPEPKP